MRFVGDTTAQLRLDSLTAVVLVHGSTCSQCKANTDNWLRLAVAMRARHPSVPIVVVSSPPRPGGGPDVSPSLAPALTEYRFVSGDVPSSLSSRFLPATVVIRRGRVDLVAYGVVGGRRRGRIVAAFDEGAR